MANESFPILERVTQLLPKNAEIADSVFEGANIVLYSKNKEFVTNHTHAIRSVVTQVKKRIEIRADQSILVPVAQADTLIRNIIPKEAEVEDLWFDEKRSIVVIEAKKQGLVIGRKGEVVTEIQKKTLWSPILRRSPAIKSDLIKTIRHTLFKNSDYRRKFLDSIGRKIYSGFHRKKNYWARISFLGAAREVGRSCFILQTPESNIMLDCGINVASDEHAFPHLEVSEADLKKLDAVIISHAHTDHSGLLPLLFKYGYRGPVYCTEPTRDIMTLMQIDSIGIAQKEGKNALYSILDIKEMLKHVIPLDYGVVTDIAPDIRITLFDAGHILGSAVTHMNIGDGFHNLVYTGDYKYSGTNLLNHAHTDFQRVETVITEGTYGKTITPSVEEAKNMFLDIVTKTIKNGGKVLLPVLGVGRSQELMIVLEKAMRDKLIPEIPIFIDGMVWDVNAIHTAYPEFFNKRIASSIFDKKHNPFLSDCFKHVGSQEERKKLVEEEGPCVIMATSGMLAGGPSMFYLENLANNPKNQMIFTCYQGVGSLGRQLQEGSTEIIKRNGNRTQSILVKLGMETIRGFSGHSDRNEILSYIGKIRPKPRRVIVVHAEKTTALDIASSIHQKYYIETTAPRNLDIVRIR
ncbi:beta-CASP ribonuclease aCPSF1 [archaeon CG10_big_fil_rev_8_21_14_0_10_43_11]|nr:MAG: beta-CASP ribonuclease aCPSF1 [archaeon CG10_big_fil_rev_8_21_14_0_10_43_11]